MLVRTSGNSKPAQNMTQRHELKFQPFSLLCALSVLFWWHPLVITLGLATCERGLHTHPLGFPREYSAPFWLRGRSGSIRSRALDRLDKMSVDITAIAQTKIAASEFVV